MNPVNQGECNCVFHPKVKNISDLINTWLMIPLRLAGAAFECEKHPCMLLRSVSAWQIGISYCECEIVVRITVYATTSISDHCP